MNLMMLYGYEKPPAAPKSGRRVGNLNMGADVVPDAEDPIGSIQHAAKIKTMNDRREAMRSLILNDGPVSYLDVAAQFPGCSDYTLYADLRYLVETGQVQYARSKRHGWWSAPGAPSIPARIPEVEPRRRGKYDAKFEALLTDTWRSTPWLHTQFAPERVKLPNMIAALHRLRKAGKVEQRKGKGVGPSLWRWVNARNERPESSGPLD